MNPIYVRVWGDLACFTRPETKVERVSYPVITPSAARGLLESILYKPQFRWRVRRIAVRSPINFINIRRNELKSKASIQNGRAVPILIDDDRTQRNTLALRDVDYVLEAEIEVRTEVHDSRDRSQESGIDLLQKSRAMAIRRIEKGQCFQQPCFGCREFPAYFERVTSEEMVVDPKINDDADFGWTLYEVFDLNRPIEWGATQENPAMTFFQAKLKKGILEIPPWEEVKKQLEAKA